MKQRTLRPNNDAPPARKERVLAPPMPLPAFRPGSSEPDQVQTAAASTEVPPVTASTEQAAGRDLRYIPVGLIDPNPLAPREVYTPQMIRDRAEALRDQGQHDPIHVIPNPDAAGRYIICDGWTRVQACIDHQVLPELLAQVHHTLSLEDAAWFGYQQNEEREQHCDLDRALFYAKLIQAGTPASVVAKRAGKSKPLMTHYTAIAKLPEAVLAIMREAPAKFGSNSGYQLYRVFEARGQARAVTLAQRYKDEDQTVRWLVGQAEAILAPAHAKPKAQTKNWRFENGYLKQRGDNIEMQVLVPAEKREEFSAALEALLNTVAIEQVTPESDE